MGIGNTCIRKLQQNSSFNHQNILSSISLIHFITNIDQYQKCQTSRTKDHSDGETFLNLSLKNGYSILKRRKKLL